MYQHIWVEFYHLYPISRSYVTFYSGAQLGHCGVIGRDMGLMIISSIVLMGNSLL